MDFHITRRHHWSNGEASPITRREWRELVQSDPELTFDGEDSALWKGPSRMEHALLVWRDGNIEGRNPDALLIRKMAAIAAALGAAAQDDDGESYDELGEPLPREVVAASGNARSRIPRVRRPRDCLWYILAFWAFVALAVFALLVWFVGGKP
jgi:hypothetical protein